MLNLYTTQGRFLQVDPVTSLPSFSSVLCFTCLHCKMSLALRAGVQGSNSPPQGRMPDQLGLTIHGLRPASPICASSLTRNRHRRWRESFPPMNVQPLMYSILQFSHFDTWRRFRFRKKKKKFKITCLTNSHGRPFSAPKSIRNGPIDMYQNKRHAHHLRSLHFVLFSSGYQRLSIASIKDKQI